MRFYVCMGGEVSVCVFERNPCSKKSTKPGTGKVLAFFAHLISKLRHFFLNFYMVIFWEL